MLRVAGKPGWHGTLFPWQVAAVFKASGTSGPAPPRPYPKPRKRAAHPLSWRMPGQEPQALAHLDSRAGRGGLRAGPRNQTGTSQVAF